MQPSKIGRLLASDAGLQPVIAKARRIGELSKLCFDVLPSGLARLVRAITLHDRPGDRQLVLLAASPAAAAKLKLLSETLRKTLSERGAEVNSVSVRVQPGRGGAAGMADASPRQPARLSASALAERIGPGAGSGHPARIGRPLSVALLPLPLCRSRPPLALDRPAAMERGSVP